MPSVPIPAEVLFQPPDRALPQLSPDGISIAYLTRASGVWNIWAGPFGGPAEPVTHSTRDILIFKWCYDGVRILYESDAQGDENWHLFCVDTKTGEIVDITPFESVYAQLISLSSSRPTEALVAINKDDPTLHDVYRVDLATGNTTLVTKNPGAVSAMQPDEPAWFADRDLNVKACIAAREDGAYDLMVRDYDDKAWRTLLTWDFEDSRNSRPLALSPEGDSIYLIDSRGSDTGRFVKVDLVSGALSVLAEDATYDAADVLFDPDTGAPLAAAFTKERREWQVVDPGAARDFEELSKLGDGALYFLPASRRHWVVGSFPDDDAGSYYAYDRRTRATTHLFDMRPELKAYPMAQMEPFRFTATDGLTIHGYLTFPPGVPREQLPMVLRPHGGPWSRDTWEFRSEGQFLASRGYLVMNVNFRGSTGYGKAFVNAGNREWAGKMHQDLVDGVRWAIVQGYANAERVSIFGGSYGGYAALVGATFTPEVFCCTIDVFGWSDLVTALKTLPSYWKPREAQWFRRVGDPHLEPDFLWSRSPLSKIDRLSRPILIAHGTNDVRVQKSASDQIVAALREREIPYEYMVFDDEGHGFRHPENQLRFFRTVERFLATHLGGAVAPDQT